MIRVVSIAALLCLLVLVLYLPSAHPPERFIEQIRKEHQALVEFWGQAPTARILQRALGLQETARQATPVPSAASTPSPGGLNGAVAQEMASVNQRLFNNSYFRSIEALVLLAAFRVSTLVECLPGLMVPAFAALVDGGFVRIVRSKEFRQHDPEMFAAYASLTILTACAAMIGFVVPLTLHPMLLPVVLLTIALLFGRGLANFHRRG